MFRTSAAFIFAGSVLAGGANAEAFQYELDPTHTTIAFTVEHIGFAQTLGLFGSVEGTFTYDLEKQELSDVQVSVSSDSVMTFNEARDKHVKSKDFLAADKYPTISFTTEGTQSASSSSGPVTGTLSLLGEERPLTLDVTLNKADTYPFGHKRFVLGLTIKGSLNRSDYGMSYGVENGLVGDEVLLMIETEAMRIE